MIGFQLNNIIMKSKIIVIAGAIGSGKSVVMKMLEKLGASTLYADKLNAELLEDSDYISLIQNAFPSVVTNGKIDKNALKELIFSDENKRQLLNSIAHPKIFELIKICQSKLSTEKIFVEIPLMSESLEYFTYDKLCVVTASYANRVDRIVARDGVSKDLAIKMIEVQDNENNIINIADFILLNDGDLLNLENKVIEFYNNV